MEELIELFKALPEREQVWLLSVLALFQDQPKELSGFLSSLQEE